jgi:hypothetical protein
MEDSSPAAKTEPIPPPTGLAAVWKHLQNWAELYAWVPVALLSIWFFAQFAYFLTGRRPAENADWIVGLGGNLVKCVFLIVLLSIARQQTGVWLTKAEQLENPSLAWAQRLETGVALCVFAYILSH